MMWSHEIKLFQISKIVQTQPDFNNYMYVFSFFGDLIRNKFWWRHRYDSSKNILGKESSDQEFNKKAKRKSFGPIKFSKKVVNLIRNLKRVQ